MHGYSAGGKEIRNGGGTDCKGRENTGVSAKWSDKRASGGEEAYCKVEAEWEGIVVDAKRWCNACKQYRERKGLQNKNAGIPQQMPQGSAVGQIVAIDIVGPLPITERNNRYIVTIVDTYSTFMALVPVEMYLRTL